MNILLINHFPLEGSGSGVYTQNIAKYLAKKYLDEVLYNITEERLVYPE